MENLFTNLFDLETGIWILHTIAYFIASISIFIIAKLCFDFRHKKINIIHELTIKDNYAFASTLVGYFIGILIVIGACIDGESFGFQMDIVNVIIFGLASVVLLNIASWINDRFILNKFNLYKEIIKDQNAGTGYIEAANYIASGLIIAGAVSGEMYNLFPEMTFGYQLSGLISLILFWLFGQFLLLAAVRFYNRMVAFDLHAELERDNVASGIVYAAVLIAIANIFGFAISYDYLGWGEMISNILLDILLAFLLLPVARWLVDAVLLPGVKLSDEIANQAVPNQGAALIEAFAYIGSSILICWCL